MNTSEEPQDWADMRLFLAIVDEGSLVAAAEQLDLSQPTVGRRLAAMEDRFGTPLFVRSGRRMQLTDSGNGILESARRMQREMMAISRSLDAQSTALCGEVTISATEGVGTEWLTPALIEFHRQYPDITINMQIENRAVDLVHREADIALRLGEPAQPDLIARKLVTVGFGLYASPEYLQQNPAVTSLEDLAEHTMVALDATSRGIKTRMAYPSEDALPGKYIYLTNSPTAQLTAVQHGFGIGALSHRWSAMVGNLQRILPEYSVANIDLWLVTHEELRHSARMRVLFDFIAARIEQDKSLFESGTRSSS